MSTLANHFPIKNLADRMTDEEFFQFCAVNKHLRIERDEHSNIYIMSPVGSISGFYESELLRLLGNWNAENSNGLVFSSSAGFTLPDTSVRSADAAWVSREKWDKLSIQDKKRFAPISPEFVAEIRSENDHLGQLKSKMERWITNGIQLAWLIDPIEKKAWIYREDETVDQVSGFDNTLSGEHILPGFELRLDRFLEV